MPRPQMTDLQKRALLFWCGCIATRAGLAFLTLRRPDLLPVIGVICAAIATGFLVIWIGGLRETGPEVFGEKIWWDNYRVVHASLYALAAYYALVERDATAASAVLFADVLLGAGAWLRNREIL